MNLIKFFCFAILIGLMIIIGKYWFVKDASFPYNHNKASNDLQITLEESTSANAQRSFYVIKARDIEGRAVFSSASTAALGQSIIDSQIFGIKRSFENSAAPYPGSITQTISCETKKYVREQNISFDGKLTKMILAVVSNRRLFGICSLEEIKYASLFWAAYDEQRKQVVSVELFSPIIDLNKVDESQEEIIKVFRKVVN